MIVLSGRMKKKPIDNYSPHPKYIHSNCTKVALVYDMIAYLASAVIGLNFKKSMDSLGFTMLENHTQSSAQLPIIRVSTIILETSVGYKSRVIGSIYYLVHIFFEHQSHIMHTQDQQSKIRHTKPFESIQCHTYPRSTILGCCAQIRKQTTRRLKLPMTSLKKAQNLGNSSNKSTMPKIHKRNIYSNNGLDPSTTELNLHQHTRLNTQSE